MEVVASGSGGRSCRRICGAGVGPALVVASALGIHRRKGKDRNARSQLYNMVICLSLVADRPPLHGTRHRGQISLLLECPRRDQQR